MFGLTSGEPKSVIAQVGDGQGILNPNVAGGEELRGLPHLTDQLISDLLMERPFLSMGEPHEFLSSSLQVEQLDELYEHLFVPINLNTASRSEILLVPGVGPRLAHEFEEYRPYTSMEQFRREIGKYVDDDEVARLESYVTID